MTPVRIGTHLIGPGHPVYVLAEGGINHNGSLDIARKLVSAAAVAGCQGFKLQRRRVDIVYTPEELARPRESPWGTTNGEQKRGLELSQADYEALDTFCDIQGLDFFASCWCEESVDDMLPLDPPAWKIASASLTDLDLLRYHRSVSDKPIILSTGMSTLAEIDRAVAVLGTENLILLHCTSTYPCVPEEINLRCIPALHQRYQVPIGFSDHSPGIPASVAAVTLGAVMIERHITLNRTMYGTDQAASLEPQGIQRLVRYVRHIEQALGDGRKRVYASEEPVKQKLRRVDTVHVGT